MPAPASHLPAGLKDALLDRFRRAAQNPEGLFAYPTGLAGMRGLGYSPEGLDALPAEVSRCYCGVGNPFAAGGPLPGERMLDVGCGAGVDAILAALLVGPTGQVHGLELSPHMLERARANAALAGVTVDLRLGGAECLPFDDGSLDRLLSNGVYNLVPDKARALAEAFRVLRPGGVFQLADQILEEGMAAACPLPGPGGAAEDWAR